MTRTILLIAALSIFTFSPAIVWGVNEIEPNNTLAEATELGIDDIGEGYADIGWEQDFWKFEIPDDGDISITITPADNDIYARLYDQGGVTLFMSNSGATATVYQANLAKGTYYLEVNAYYYSFPTNYSFDITFSNAPEVGYDDEPNGTYEEALTISEDGDYEGHINYFGYGVADMWDIYKVETSDDGRLQIMMEPEKPVFVWVYIMDGDMTTILAQANDDAFFSIEKADVAKGTYYILIGTYYTFDATGYQMSVSLTPPSNEGDPEPNNTAAEAMTFSTDDTAEGHLGYVLLGNRDIIDWYQISIPYEGDLECTLTSERPVDVVCTIYDQDQTTVLATASGLGTVSVSMGDQDAGTYYVAVNMYYTGEYSGYALENNYYTDVVGIHATENASELIVYPNPATDHISFTIPGNWNGTSQMEIFDHQGKLISSYMVIPDNGRSITVSTNALPSGLYMVKIGDETKTYHAQFIITK